MRSEEEAWQIIDSPPRFCVISWVTRDCKPVACAMAYVVLDGKMMPASTSHRDKIKAFRRWTEARVGGWGRPMWPEERQLEIDRSESPDRLLIIAHIEKMRTFDGAMTFQAESEQEVL